jgi:hypothetical protein
MARGRRYDLDMELHRSVTEFFHDEVTSALATVQVEATEPTEFYLVNLLADFTKTSHVDDAPLALRMAQAAASTPEERARALKDIGDTSLYVSGFFADSLARKLVDVDYYISIGGSAYGQLAGLVSGRGPAPGTFREVYDELAGKFDRFVEVLSTIRSRTNMASSTNVLRLYEEWVRTKSEWIERRLKATGLLNADAFSSGKPIH